MKGTNPMSHTLVTEASLPSGHSLVSCIIRR